MTRSFNNLAFNCVLRPAVLQMIEPNAHLQSGDSVRMRKFWIGRELGDGDAEKFLYRCTAVEPKFFADHLSASLMSLRAAGR